MDLDESRISVQYFFTLARHSCKLKGDVFNKFKFLLIGIFCLPFNQISIASDTIPKYNVRFIPSYGDISGFTNKPNTSPFDLSEDLSGIGDQYETSIEVNKIFSFCSVGLGYGSINRWGSAIAAQHNHAYKIYVCSEIASSKVRFPLTLNFQAGFAQGIILDKNLFFFGGGPLLNFPKAYHRFNFSAFVLFEFYSKEKVDKHMHIDASGVPYDFHYTLNYSIHTINYGVIIQYNFFKK